MKFASSKQAKFINPVCGMTVDGGQNPATAAFDSMRYYFCTEGCRRAFEKDPCKYIEARAPKPKGWWGRYLDRLNKATGGKSLQCH